MVLWCMRAHSLRSCVDNSSAVVFWLTSPSSCRVVDLSLSQSINVCTPPSVTRRWVVLAAAVQSVHTPRRNDYVQLYGKNLHHPHPLFASIVQEDLIPLSPRRPQFATFLNSDCPKTTDHTTRIPHVSISSTLSLQSKRVGE